MIFDTLNNSDKYGFLGDNFIKAFNFLKTNDLKTLPDGRYDIDGDRIYANIQTLKTKPEKEKKWEVHRKYIDIQYVISKKEKMGFGLLEDFKKTIIEYDDKKDIAFLDGNIFNFITLKENDFVIFYPTDVHAPMLSAGEENIKKVIIKIML